MTLLVNAVAPGLCPGGKYCMPGAGLTFLQRAMERAESWLGVPQVTSHLQGVPFPLLADLNLLELYPYRTK